MIDEFSMELNPSFSSVAVVEYKKNADAGDAIAQYLYSDALANGLGCTRNLPVAMEYAMKAAVQGVHIAFIRVGNGYKNGWGVEVSMDKAVEWYRRFIDWVKVVDVTGNAHVQNALGVCYKYGRGVAKDDAEAVKWYRKSAEQGNVRAQTQLGLCYENGEGVEKNWRYANYNDEQVMKNWRQYSYKK